MIKTVNREYNGGGVYVYYGELDNGSYYITDTMDVVIVDEDPKNLEESLTNEWQGKHYLSSFGVTDDKEKADKFVSDVLRIFKREKIIYKYSISNVTGGIVFAITKSEGIEKIVKFCEDNCALFDFNIDDIKIWKFTDDDYFDKNNIDVITCY